MISQREAKRLQKENKELKEVLRRQNTVWASDWPLGVHVASAFMSDSGYSAIKTSLRLGHAVVVSLEPQSTSCIRFHAINLKDWQR